jgi:glutathione S-transferase
VLSLCEAVCGSLQEQAGSLSRLVAGVRVTLELYQTEWCPGSRRVREHLTELGVDYVVRQVPVERDARTALVAATGGNTIPALVIDSEAVLVGEEEIEAYLIRRFEEPPEAEAHRVKAARARRRYLEEECKCLQPATR